jgi:hypothetical protein
VASPQNFDNKSKYRNPEPVIGELGRNTITKVGNFTEVSEPLKPMPPAPPQYNKHHHLVRVGKCLCKAIVEPPPLIKSYGMLFYVSKLLKHLPN